MFIQTEATPNPATLKFLPGRVVMPEGTFDARDPRGAAASPLAEHLFAIPGVAGVFFGYDFITITKNDGEWQHLKPAILGAIMEHFMAGAPILLNPDGGADAEEGEEFFDADDATTVATIKELLETRIRPAVAGDGGDITFRGYRDGVVYLVMKGACSGCPSSTATLKHGIQNLLRHFLPDVREVQSVEVDRTRGRNTGTGLTVGPKEMLLPSQTLDVGVPLDETALDQLFRAARTFTYWVDRPVSDATLRAVADLAKMGPTSANCSPARFVFVVSADAKERLRPHLSRGNVRQTMSAPATAIVGYDMEFYEKLGFLFPHEPGARGWFTDLPEKIQETALRNSALQGAYLILAARALGLDCGPMSGFDAAGVEATFFPGGRIRANFLINLGYGDREKLHPRAPRFPFDEFCAIV